MSSGFPDLPNITPRDGYDPFIYASMPSNMSSTQISSLATKLGLSANDPTTITNKLNGTTYKRACCMGKTTIPVKLPIPTNYGGTLTPINTDYNYIEKNVPVTTDVCGEFTPHSTQCDEFFETYCANVKNDYETLLNGSTFDPAEWNAYSPECACYGKTLNDYAKESSTTISSQFLNNIAPICYMSGCNNVASAYQDPQSRKATCDTTICEAYVKLENTTAGRDLTISGTNIVQNCSNTSDSGTTDTGTTDSGTTTGTTTDTIKTTTSTSTGSGTTTGTTTNTGTTDTTKTTTGTSTGSGTTTNTGTTGTSTTTSTSTTKTTTGSGTADTETPQTEETSYTKYYIIGGGLSLLCCICCLFLLIFGIIIIS